MNRRNALTRLVQGVSTAAAGIVGIPAAVHAISPGWTTPRRDTWRSLGRLEAFTVERVTTAEVLRATRPWARTLERQRVYVWRPRKHELVVLSPACTDLGCPVRWDAGSECFLCPCHGGIFAKDGTRMAGPPRRPLHRYAARVRGGGVEIDLSSVPPVA
jgi:menaquinol-cytochrome c reductase iron-sulfur subunit